MVKPCLRVTLYQAKKHYKLEGLSQLTNAEVIKMMRYQMAHHFDPLVETGLEIVSGQNRSSRQAFYKSALDDCSKLVPLLLAQRAG